MAATKSRKGNPKHGFKHHPLYSVYQGMKERCYRETNTHFARYGGRGITICDEWLESNVEFFNWALANGWEDGLQIDRIDNDGNYSPKNCRWVTPTENARNTSRTVKFKAFGVEATLMELLEISGSKVPFNTVYNRIVGRGWEVERAIMQPSHVNPVITAFGVSGNLKEVYNAYPSPAVSFKTFKTRVVRDMEAEVALTLPLQKIYKNKKFLEKKDG